MGGTNLCPWCDCGVHRDGRPFTYRDLFRSKNVENADQPEAVRGTDDQTS